jgi:hypothetical protein
MIWIAIILVVWFFCWRANNVKVEHRRQQALKSYSNRLEWLDNEKHGGNYDRNSWYL